MALEIPPAAGLLKFSFICLNAPDSRGALVWAAWGLFPSFARAASIRAAASAAKDVSTIGAIPPAGAAFLVFAADFFATVVLVFAAADLVVFFSTAGFAFDLVVAFLGAALGLLSL